MQNTVISRNTAHHYLPRLGQRILKTSFAVFICLMIYYLRGYYGGSMQTESVITAIICMQPYVRDTREYAINRLAGSLIGAVLGLLFLFLLLAAPDTVNHPVVLYSLMSLGVLFALYSAVLIKKPDTSGLAAIVFLCVVISFPDIEHPLQQAVLRIVDVFIGTTVAIGVNVFRLPRRKNRNLLFFIHAHDLAPDHYSQISSGSLFHLNYLYDDGARICLISEHAPAFFILQMNNIKVNTPLIVMDGAAIYDIGKSQYLYRETIPEEASATLIDFLDAHGLSYFIYTIHKNRTSIFHRGPFNEDETKILERMRRSHYRYYLEDDIYELSEIVYFKIVFNRELENPALHAEIDSIILRHNLRSVSRIQVSAPDAHGVYIYSANATVAHAKEKLLSIMQENGHRLSPCEIMLEHGFQSERDAIHLLNLVGRRYEPFILTPEKTA